jgi:hypothetical protein
MASVPQPILGVRPCWKPCHAAAYCGHLMARTRFTARSRRRCASVRASRAAAALVLAQVVATPDARMRASRHFEILAGAAQGHAALTNQLWTPSLEVFD